MHTKVCEWFGARTAQDDEAAISVSCIKPLFPDTQLSQHENSTAIISNINNRFNGSLDRFIGGSFDSLSESIGVLNKLFQEQNFDFSNLEDRKALEEVINKGRFEE